MSQDFLERPQNVDHLPEILVPRRAYSQFPFDPANRNVKANNVARLAEGIDTMYLLDLYPIVTDTEMVILDGQHRFTAARDMGLPFYSIDGNDITITDIAEANSNTHRYDDKDALTMYCAFGIKPYLYLQEFLLRNPSATLTEACAWLDDERLPDDFVEGSFAIRRPEYAQVVAGRVNDFVTLCPWVKSAPAYKRALANLTLNPQYDHARMMNRLRAVTMRLLRGTTYVEAFACLTEIYNYNIAKNNRIELYYLGRHETVNRYDKGLVDVIEGLEKPVRSVSNYRQVEVHFTSDLEKFSIHPSARPLREKRLAALTIFMAKKNLLRYYPILVDRNYQILDGQMRYLAAKELGIPIHYIVTNQFSLHMSALAAGRARSWGSRDYLKLYCTMRYTEYLYLQQFCNRYPHLDVGAAIHYLCRGYTKASKDFMFKTGSFQATERKRAESLATVLERVEDTRLRSNRLFQLVMWQLLENPAFDVGRFISKLNKNRHLVGVFGDTKECLEQMSNVYNISVRGERTNLEDLLN